jgi:hypothetical protein
LADVVSVGLFYLMNPSESEELRLRLEVMDHRGESPGFVSDVPRVDGAASLSSPTIAEMEAAIQHDVSTMSPGACLRAMLLQNNVLLRDAIWRRQHASVVAFSSEHSGSLRSSLTTTGSNSGQPSPGDSRSGSPVRKKKSPPKVFDCPVCHKSLNEKDFDRHIFVWISKLDKTFVVRSDTCAGIQHADHPLLQRFPHGNLRDRVASVVRYIRSLVHPGAYDALDVGGSGRHVHVAHAVQWLLGN